MGPEFSTEIGTTYVPHERFDVKGHSEHNDKMIRDQASINLFLSELLKAKKNGDSLIDFSDPIHSSLVDNVRDIDPDLVHAGIYSWDVDHLYMLIEKLQDHVNAIGRPNAGNTPELDELIHEFDAIGNQCNQDHEDSTSPLPSPKFGYDIGAMCLPLQERRYEFGMKKIEAHLEKIEKWTEDKKNINLFLTAILNAKQNGDTLIDFNQPNLRAIVDKVREVNPGLIPADVYSWDLDHLPMLTENLQTRVATIESSIALSMMRANYDMQELTELIREYYDMLKQDRDGKMSIIRNSGR